MNLVLLLLFLGCIFISVPISQAFDRLFSTPLALVFGIGTSVLLVGLVYGLLRVLVLLLNRWRPVRPLCRQGKCLADDYEFIERTEQGRLFECRCGTRYIHSGMRFLECSDDGQIKPYMKHAQFGRWCKDDVRSGAGALLVLLFIAVSSIGCSSSKRQFGAVTNYLETHPVSSANDAELVEVLDYFILRPFKQKAFLVEQAGSSDAKTAITAQLILASLARGANELRKQTSDSVTHDLLVEIDLDDLLEKCHDVSTNGLSPAWIEWRTVSIDVLGLVMTDQSKTNIQAVVTHPH